MEDIQLEEGVSRRKVLAAAAWATPVVAVAAAAPLAAASGDPEPLPQNFYNTVTTDATVTGGVYQNLTVKQGAVRLEGAPGDTAGVITIRIDVPVGYTWEPNDQWGWTVVQTEVNGRDRFTYTWHEDLTIGASANVAEAYFFGGTMVGSGASSDNYAALRVASSNLGGSTTLWPDED